MKKILGMIVLMGMCIMGVAQTPKNLIDCNEDDFLMKTSSALVPPAYVKPTKNMWKRWSSRRSTLHTLTHQKNSIVLGATTTITAEDIALTPARNLLDLIEAYVPGAHWLNHEEGKVLGMRGVMAPRNLRYQVFVDGVNVNQHTHSGAINELENWDMDDIAKIEVIRGAAAARYGTGAVTGVILITTKTAGRGKQTQVNGGFVSNYNSLGGNFSHSVSNNDLGFYVFGSWRKTSGYSPNAFAMYFNAPLPSIGYIGQDFSDNTSFFRPVLATLADYDDQPQLKVAAQLKFRKKWDLRLRYTTAGSTLNGVSSQSFQQTGLVVDSVTTDANGFPVYHYSREFAKQINLKSFRTRQFTASLSRQWQYLDSVSKKGYIINAQVSWNTQDYESRADSLHSFGIDVPEIVRKRLSDINDPLYKRYNFSEHTLNARLMGSYIFPIGQIALGAEYTRKNIGYGWGDISKDMRLGENGTLINASNSRLLNYPEYGGIENILSTTMIGNRWYSYWVDAFAEANITPVKWVNITTTSRLTNHAYSKSAWHHRFALTVPINASHVIQLNQHVAHHLGSEEQLYEAYTRDQLTSPERFSGLELHYYFTPNPFWHFALHGYSNNTEFSRFDQKLRKFQAIGVTRYSGIEVEASYQSRSFRAGLNYSKVNATVSDNITRNFNDSIYVAKAFFNNSPNQMLKLWARYKFFHKRVAIQANMRTMWDYAHAVRDLNERIYPLLDTAVIAAENPQELTSAEVIRATYRAQKPYSLDVRLDISASLKISENITVSAYILNLLTNNRGRRYSYDDDLQLHELDPQFQELGIGDVITARHSWVYSPQRFKFIEEPLVFGLKLNIKL